MARRSSGLPALSDEGKTIAVADLARSGRPRRVDELVTGGNHGRFRTTSDEKAGLADGGGDRDRDRVEPGAAPKNHVAFFDFTAAGCDVLSALDRLDDLDVIAFGSRLLDHLNRVGSLGDRRAGHDLSGFAATDAKIREASGRNLADDGELGRDVGEIVCAHREPVDRRSWKRRHVDVRRDVFPKKPPACVVEVDFFGRQRLHVLENNRKRFVNRKHSLSRHCFFNAKAPRRKGDLLFFASLR